MSRSNRSRRARDASEGWFWRELPLLAYLRRLQLACTEFGGSGAIIQRKELLPSLKEPARKASKKSPAQSARGFLSL